jgi:hypothetical protein
MNLIISIGSLLLREEEPWWKEEDHGRITMVREEGSPEKSPTLTRPPPHNNDGVIFS